MRYLVKYSLFIFCIACSTNVMAQMYISGFVKDSVSGERLIGATIMDIQSGKGCVTDNQGFFSLRIKDDTQFQISYVGYASRILNIHIKKDTLLDILLTQGYTLSTVEISAAVPHKFNVATLTTQEITQIPHLSGKPDVLKAVQFLPGIRSQGEMSSVTLVRGGNPGENLYLIDQTPLIYVHHIGGFMSVFNPDMINDVEVYKGAFPAKYGERLSSVINISQKEGNKSSLRASLSVGLTDIGFSLEGPTKLKNSSFIFTGRKTFTELFYLLATSISEANAAYLTYGFHDINGKFSWSPNQRNSLHVNIYQGDDYLQLFSKPVGRFGVEERFKTSNIWGNWLVSTNWKYVYSSKLFFDNTLSYTYYRLKNTAKMVSENLTTKRSAKSGIQDVSLRSEVKYLVLDNWNVDFGLKASYLLFNPISISGDNISNQINDEISSMEAVLYWDNKIQLWEKLDARLGLRWVNYLSKDFFHPSLEPRVSLSYAFLPKYSLNVSYMRVSQNAQLLYNIGNISANEIYIPSGKDIPVAFSDQVSMGWSADFFHKILQIELNVYYKTLNNLSTYKEGFNYAVGDIYWRDKIETGGKGKIGGIELLIRKTKGKWTGFGAYAYSKSIRQYQNINEGKPFPFEYDSPHTVSLSVSYMINEKWSVSAAWQFQSGLPYTPAIGRNITIDIDENGNYTPYEVLVYGKKNSARMRAYHKLDFAFKYTNYTKKRHRKYEWTFGLFNAYNRQNPYYYYYNSSVGGEIYNPRIWGEFEALNLYQVAMFPIMPMVSYKVWFWEASEKTKKNKMYGQENK